MIEDAGILFSRYVRNCVRAINGERPKEFTQVLPGGVRTARAFESENDRCTNLLLSR